jgi:hypothetical protein
MNYEAPTAVQYQMKFDIPTAVTVLSLPILALGNQSTINPVTPKESQIYAASQPSYTVNDFRTLFPASKLRDESYQVLPEIESIKNLIRNSFEFTKRLSFLPGSDAADDEIEEYFSTKIVKTRKIFRKS